MVTNLIIPESQHEAIDEQFCWPAVRDALDGGDELAEQALEQEQAGSSCWRSAEPAIPLQQFVKAGRDHINSEQDVVWPRFGRR